MARTTTPTSLAADIHDAMPAWLQETFLGITGWKYLAILLLIFVAITLQKIVVTLIGRSLRSVLTEGSRTQLAAEKVSRPVGGLAMALVFHFGLPPLEFSALISDVGGVATDALAAFSLVWLGYQLTDVLGDYLAERAAKSESKLDDQIVPLVTKTFKVFVSVVGAIFILQNLRVDVGSLLAGLGLGGLAFALAAKDTVANFFGSLMIFLDRPFQIGDWVVIAGVEGLIEEVGFRTTRIRTFYNSLVTVPNAKIVDSAIDNYGARKYRRYTCKLALPFETPPERVQAFCEGVRAIIVAMPETRKDYYVVELQDLGPHSLQVLLYMFFAVPSWTDELRARHQLNLELLRLAHALDVRFAVPTQTVHVESLGQLGTRPEPPPPRDRAELAAIVDSFGPGAHGAERRTATVTSGYDLESS